MQRKARNGIWKNQKTGQLQDFGTNNGSQELTFQKAGLNNNDRLCTDDIREGATVAADDHVRQLREVLQDPPTGERRSAPLTRMGSITGNYLRTDSNVNNMADLFTSTMVNTFTQCTAKMRPSVSNIRPTPDSFTKTYDLANWNKQRNASDVPLIPVSGTTQRTDSHRRTIYVLLLMILVTIQRDCPCY